ncbi:MAG TPA: YdeI/OmpD-associated family protein [Terriglobales bacterium]|jgi:uncharacterized protein YdeI (YjbR/CyaY-like superfamily)|nr:YdeI/OmpD-associated family protein [Terriglobales bacterium]
MAAARQVAKSFDAVLERMPGRLGWTIVRIPFDVKKVWGVRGHLRIKGEINSFPFRTSLFPTGRGTHYLLVNKKMQRGGAALPGSRARLRLEPDTEERVVTVPEELTRALAQSKRLEKWYATAFSASMRNWIARWVGEPKSAASRRRRAEDMAERLMLAMEAERGELPPALELAFAREPRARTGWKRMPAAARRHHLLGIFGYRSPEARARRLDKAVEEMLRYAGKAGR